MEDEKLKLLSSIDKYINSKHKQDNKLKNIAKILEQQLQRYNALRPEGRNLLPKPLADGEILRKVYLSNDTKLINIFRQQLPIPPISLFEQNNLPDIIKARQQLAITAICNIIKRNNGDLSAIERAILPLQRMFKAKKYKQEQKSLITNKFRNNINEDDLNKIITDKNTPYMPQCDNSKYPGLANRLLQASANIKLFSEIRHLTATTHLPSVLDNGIMGRRSLLENFTAFRKNAFDEFVDSKNGDSDAICFGSGIGNIDPKSMQENTAELIIDLDKLRITPNENTNPCIFFKQLDFGLSLDNRCKKLNIGNKKIYFAYNYFDLSRINPLHTNIAFFNKYINFKKRLYANDVQACSEVFTPLLISSNFASMDHILIMNFFRFLDLYHDFNNRPSHQFIDEIYHELNTLNESQLVSLLTEIGTKISDTMEFNFYRSYLVNFDLIKEINIFIKPDIKAYTLNFADFIEQLNNGNINKLNEVNKIIPQLLQSYRFIDYLISNIDNSTIKDHLIALQSNIPQPEWFTYARECRLKNNC